MMAMHHMCQTAAFSSQGSVGLLLTLILAQADSPQLLADHARHTTARIVVPGCSPRWEHQVSVRVPLIDVALLHRSTVLQRIALMCRLLIPLLTSTIDISLQG